jgi:hypothetical protein
VNYPCAILTAGNLSRCGLVVGNNLTPPREGATAKRYVTGTGVSSRPLKRNGSLTRTTMTTNMTPTKTKTPLSNHCSQFSELRPISPKPRMRSPCRESSSQIRERTV